MDMIDSVHNTEIAVQDAVSEDYETIRYIKDYSVLYQNLWYDDMVSLITQKGLILDNGCGIGHLAEFLPMDNMVGFDISKGMLGKAKSRMNRLVRGDSQRLPFKDETFDVIFCRSLLHHLPDPCEGVYEMDRVLKKEGELIVSEPIQSVLSNIPRKLVKGGEHFSDVHKDFKEQTLIEMLQERFIIEEVKYFGYVAYPVLGFPDVVDPLRYLPFKKGIASFLIHVDQLVSRIPIIKTQSWGITVKAAKRPDNPSIL